MDKETIEIAVSGMLLDLQVLEGDSEIAIEDGEKVALIPYYSHGRMRVHKIPLEAMIRSVLHAINLTTKYPPYQISKYTNKEE